MEITADDRLDIIELPGRYAEALDTLQPEQLRDVFTEDAVWEVPGKRRLEGMDEIMEFMARPEVHPGAHLMINIFISGVDSDSSSGTVVHMRSRGIFPVGPSNRHDPTAVFYGRYEDEVVQTDDGWRIRYRRYENGGGQPN